MHGGGVLWPACHWLLVGTKISFCALAPLVGDRMIFCTANCQSFGSRSDGDRHPRENCQIQVQPGTHTHARLMALFPGLPRWAGTRKVKPIWILLKQETVSGTGISWAVCKSASRSRQITMSAPHHSVFYRLVALPATQPTASKHWRQKVLPGNWCQMRGNWRYWCCRAIEKVWHCPIRSQSFHSHFSSPADNISVPLCLHTSGTYWWLLSDTSSFFQLVGAV